MVIWLLQFFHGAVRSFEPDRTPYYDLSKLCFPVESRPQHDRQFAEDREGRGGSEHEIILYPTGGQHGVANQ